MTATALTLDRPAARPARDAAAAASAAVTAFAFYAFGTVPLVLGTAAELGLSPAQTTSWLTAVWLTGGLATLALTLAHRQPIQIVWSIPGIVLIGAVGEGLSYAELVGANLAAGALLLVLALAGAGERLLRLLPLPILLGSFAGSMLPYLARAAEGVATDAAVGLAAVAGYASARLLPRAGVPPVAPAALAGGAAAALAGRIGAGGGDWGLPTLVAPAPALDPATVLTVAVPLALLSLALGTAQGLGFLVAQGYEPPVRRISLAVGAASLLNAALGAHQAQVSRAGTAIVAGPGAGAREGRWRASALAGASMLGLALAAGSAFAVASAVPASLVAVVVGLAVLPVLRTAARGSLAGPLRLGGGTALVVAALPVGALGTTAAVWAIPAGLAVSFLAERGALVAAVRPAPAPR